MSRLRRCGRGPQQYDGKAGRAHGRGYGEQQGGHISLEGRLEQIASQVEENNQATKTRALSSPGAGVATQSMWTATTPTPTG